MWKRPEGVVIGCVSLVYMDELIVAINCAKGRGLVLPGGKCDEAESFHQAAARELYEEAGLTATKQRFLFGGADCDGVFCYAFLTEVAESALSIELKPNRERHSVELVSWDVLIQRSYYHGYYRVLREVIMK
jgi:8-oxo-dGTP pyrophosphatase MutT (NUDIX family)